MSFTRTSILSSLALAGMLLAGTAAYASSDGGSSDSGAQTPSCKTGYVWNEQNSRCEPAKSSSLDDRSLYEQGRDLALAGRYQQALAALNAIKRPDAMTLTMIGYSERKMGHYQQAMDLYAKALALEPNNINTHEYMGEAYAEQGRPDLAKAELLKIKAVAGTDTEQYRDLAGTIAGKPDAS
jgi:tetratricopeptide (TPR) repeat protein